MTMLVSEEMHDFTISIGRPFSPHSIFYYFFRPRHQVDTAMATMFDRQTAKAFELSSNRDASV